MKAIIFDADGMIVHGTRFSMRLEKEFGISLEKTSDFFKTVFQDCLIGEKDLKEELPKYLKEWGWEKSLDELLTFWFDKEANFIETRFEPVIKDLRNQGIKCYLATNNEKYRTENLTNDRGLEKWFDGVYSSAFIHSKKPEAAFFKTIIDDIKLPIEQITFWDDDPENIEGAKEFGFKTEIYTSFEDFVSRIH